MQAEEPRIVVACDRSLNVFSMSGAVLKAITLANADVLALAIEGNSAFLLRSNWVRQKWPARVCVVD
jgi:hypothetical protein